MTEPTSEPRSRWSVLLLLFGSLAVISFFVALNPPTNRAVTAEAGTEASRAPTTVAEVAGLSFAGADIVPGVPTLIPMATPDHRAGQVLLLRLGPDDRYLPLGQIGRGARVEVVGRNDKGDWLAVSLLPGSTLYGWVRATTITGTLNVTTLPVVLVKLLP